MFPSLNYQVMVWCIASLHVCVDLQRIKMDYLSAYFTSTDVNTDAGHKITTNQSVRIK